jgi:serine/threonine protein kinase
MPVSISDGTVLNYKYRVINSIGMGGMGAVVRVMRLADSCELALKYCTENDPESLKRFTREVRIMQGISHPHVIRVIDADLSASPPYFVMPLATDSLQAEIPYLSSNELAALEAFEHVCMGVQAIHNSNGVHRDIKPRNALRMSDGRVVVSDLGLAKLDPRDTTTITQTGVFLGTRAYCAPEQLLPGGSRGADPRTDIYQLGKTLYELLTGNNPALIDRNLLPPGLTHVIRKATSEHPDDRYQTLGEFLDAIGYYRSSRNPTQNPRETFESLAQQAVDLLRRHEIEPDNIRSMLSILRISPALQVDSLLSLFDMIPRDLLPIIAADYSAELHPALETYADAIETAVAARPYPYAEVVASAMRQIFTATASGAIKALALRAILVAAVQLHRFAAMDVFDTLLRSVRLPDDAIPIAEMLLQARSFYRSVADRIPADQLCSAVRTVRDEVLRA